MSDTYDASELRVEEAIEAFRHGEFPSAAAAAKAYDLEPRRLQFFFFIDSCFKCLCSLGL